MADADEHITVSAWFNAVPTMPLVKFPTDPGRPELTAFRDTTEPGGVTVTATFEDCTVHLTADAYGGVDYHFHPAEGGLFDDSPWDRRVTVGVLAALGSLALRLIDCLEQIEQQAGDAAAAFSTGSREYRASGGQTLVTVDINPTELSEKDPVDPVAAQLLRKALEEIAQLD